MTSVAVRSVHHTSFCVANLEAAVHFFAQALGVRASSIRHVKGSSVGALTGLKGAELRLAMLELGNHKVELIQYLSPPSATPAALRPCDVGATHLALVVDDLERAIEAVIGAGGSLNGSPQRTAEGTRSVYARTSDGIQLEFIQFEVNAG